MAVIGLLAAFSTIGLPSPAHGDPAYESASGLVTGVGSDTIQDVFDAYTGANPYPPSSAAKFYAPMHSDAAGGNAQVASFDAVPAGGSTTAPGCITAKLNGPAFDRPDGSGNGINALLAAQSAATPWQNPTASKRCTAAAVNVQGQIDFARSSRGPATTGTTLTFIPFARDALSVGYYDHGTNSLNNLTLAQLQALYTSATGTITVAGHTVHACLVQSGSGTRSSFVGKLGVSDATALAAATASGCGDAYEEHGGDAFWTYASTLSPTDDAVIPFSVAQWICQANANCTDRSGTARANGVDVADLDNTAVGTKPYSGTAPNMVGDAGYFASFWGRDVYAVVLTSKIGTGLGSSASLKGIFKGSTSAICSSANQATRALFGFGAPVLACGATSLTGNS